MEVQDNFMQFKKTDQYVDEKDQSVSNNLYEVNEQSLTDDIRFDPNKRYNSGLYLAGTDVPVGWVKIVSNGLKNDDQIKVLILDTSSRKRTEFITKMQEFWIELNKNCCCYISSTSNAVTYNFIPVEYYSPCVCNETLTNGVYKIGSEILTGWCKVIPNEPKNDSSFYMTVSDNCFIVNHYEMISHETWINIPDSGFLFLYSNNSFGFGIMHRIIETIRIFNIS